MRAGGEDGGGEDGRGGVKPQAHYVSHCPYFFSASCHHSLRSPALSLLTKSCRTPKKKPHGCVCQRKKKRKKSLITLMTFHAISASSEDSQFVPQTAKRRLQFQTDAMEKQRAANQI